MAGNESVSAPPEEDDSEWEYEYHEAETESFYVTLDISSATEYNNPRAQKTKPEQLPTKVLQQTTSIVPTSPVAEDNADPSEGSEALLQEIAAPMDIDQTPGQPEEEPPLLQPNKRIQILDLHAENPLISFQNRMYSCEWTSTLGTDLLLTTPMPNFHHPVLLREKPNVSVLAASNIKLMGRTAQIASRHSAEEGGQPSTPAPESSIAPTDTASPDTATPVKIPLSATSSRARQTQAKFLERLIAIKAQKGEKDNVTVFTQNVNQGTGWRSQRKASEVIEDADNETTPKQRGSGTGGRPRGSRKLRGPRTAKGGLFRDYRPQLWDTPGADIRGGPSSTPASWDQLEGGASDERQTPTITVANACPLPPADQPEQAAKKSSRSLSASASADASPTPSFRPVQSSAGESISSAEHATPSPSPSPASGLQTSKATGEGVVPASGAPDAETPQQRETEASMAQQSTPARDTATGALERSGVAAAGDVEMKDVW